MLIGTQIFKKSTIRNRMIGKIASPAIVQSAIFKASIAGVKTQEIKKTQIPIKMIKIIKKKKKTDAISISDGNELFAFCEVEMPCCSFA